jgi:hypothetical protein
MGEKVSKIKKGISKNLIKAIEFDDSVDKVGMFETFYSNLLDAQEITDLIQTLTSSNNTSVTSFSITGPTILTDEVAKNASIFLKSYHTDTIRVRVIRSLCLAFKKAKFESTGINKLFNALMYTDIVGELVITLDSYSPFDQSNLDSLKMALLATETQSGETNKCKLTKLTIGGFAVTPAISKSFSELMSKQQRVVFLSLHNWELNAENVQKLVQEGNPFVFLDLTGTELRDDSCQVIGEAFSRGCLNKLRRIILNSNAISEKGVQFLIDGIENSENTVLHDVQLKDNTIADESIVEQLNAVLTRRGGDKHKTLPDSTDLKDRFASAVMASKTTEEK